MPIVGGTDEDTELKLLRSRDKKTLSNILAFEETPTYTHLRWESISSEVIGQERPQSWIETRSREFYNQLINISKKLLDEKKFTVGRTSHGRFITKDEELAFETLGKNLEKRVLTLKKGIPFLRLADIPKSFMRDMGIKFQMSVKNDISVKGMNTIFAIDKAAEQLISEAERIAIESNDVDGEPYIKNFSIFDHNLEVLINSEKCKLPKQKLMRKYK